MMLLVFVLSVVVVMVVVRLVVVTVNSPVEVVARRFPLQLAVAFRYCLVCCDRFHLLVVRTDI